MRFVCFHKYEYPCVFSHSCWANTMAKQSKFLALLQREQNRQMIIAMTYRLLQLKKRKNKSKHRWWVHSMIKKIYHNLYMEMEVNLFREMEVHLSGEKFKEYLRLNREQFVEVLSYVEEDLKKHGSSPILGHSMMSNSGFPVRICIHMTHRSLHVYDRTLLCGYGWGPRYGGNLCCSVGPPLSDVRCICRHWILP